MNGESSGSKVSTDAAQPEDYCTSKQIRHYFQDGQHKKEMTA